MLMNSNRGQRNAAVLICNLQAPGRQHYFRRDVGCSSPLPDMRMATTEYALVEGVSDLAMRRAGLLRVIQRNLNADRTGKIALPGAFPKIAGDIQHPFGVAVTDQAILRVIDWGQGA